jgi:hypothetical protein
MTKNPQWLDEAVSRAGVLFDAGDLTQAKAIVSLRETIKAHPDYVNAVIDRYASALFNEWQRTHRFTLEPAAAEPDPEPGQAGSALVPAAMQAATPKPKEPSPRQEALFEIREKFPDIKSRYRTTPNRYTATIDLDRHTLETAKNMLWATTQNAIDGARDSAEAERKIFQAFYDEYHDRLHGTLTIGDLLHV